MDRELSTGRDEILALPAARGPLDPEVLARAADGVAFTHELSAVEVASGMLSADDDLALWAQFAIAGLPLAGGGEVGATTVLDLPPGIGDDLPAGQGMIGQLLTGPDGWLAEFSGRGSAVGAAARRCPGDIGGKAAGAGSRRRASA